MKWLCCLSLLARAFAQSSAPDAPSSIGELRSTTDTRAAPKSAEVPLSLGGAGSRPVLAVEGRVVIAASGEAVRKAEVTLDVSPSDGDTPELVATTDDAGHFRFADLKPGTYKLTAEKKGFLGGGFGQVAPHDPQTLLKINAGESMNAITLRLFPAASISGRVLDAEGDPAENRACCRLDAGETRTPCRSQRSTIFTPICLRWRQCSRRSAGLLWIRSWSGAT